MLEYEYGPFVWLVMKSVTFLPECGRIMLYCWPMQPKSSNARAENASKRPMGRKQVPMRGRLAMRKV